MTIEPIIPSFDLSPAVRLFVPPHAQSALSVLVCLPGASYSAAGYWHAMIPGRDGYSFAEFMARRGYYVATVDHAALHQFASPVDAGITGMAANDARITEELRTRLAKGTLPGLSRPLNVPIIGVGHSMGGYVGIVAQADWRAFDALAVLGAGVEFDPMYDGRTGTPFAQSLANVGPGTFPGWLTFPRKGVEALFYYDDVPQDVIDADTQAAVDVPAAAMAALTQPGFLVPYAARVDVPVLFATGWRDLVADPAAEQRHYPLVNHFTNFRLPRAGHCTNFAGNRTHLWNTVAGWANSLDLGPSLNPAGWAHV